MAANLIAYSVDLATNPEKMYKVTLDQESRHVTRTDEGYLIDDAPIAWDIRQINDTHFHILEGNRSIMVEVVSWDRDSKLLTVRLHGKLAELHIQDPRDLLLEKLGIRDVQRTTQVETRAPMPGLILSISVTAGQQVKKGDTLLVLEAMKMENAIKAPQDGTVSRVAVSQGQSVEKNQVLIQF